MKVRTLSKILFGLTSLALAGTSVADTIFGVYAGAGVWNGSLSGNVGKDAQPITADELGMGSDNNTFYYLAVEHPVPVLPNFMLSHTSLSTSGKSTVTRDFTFNNTTVPANADTTTSVDLSHTDLTLYYEILDNYLSWDLGVTGRNFDGYASIDYTSQSGNGSEKVSLKGIVPLAYTKLQIDLPFSGWFVGGSMNYVGYRGDSFSDLDAKLGYMTDGLGLDVGFDFGYRQMKLKVEKLDDLKADLTEDGPYASLLVHF